MANEHTVTLIENDTSQSVKAMCGPELIGKVCKHEDGWKLHRYISVGQDCERMEPEGPATDRKSALGRLIELILARG